MGLLDDLRNQAQTKKAADEEEAARKADREQYYQEKILPRMIKAYQFFNEFVDHLNYISLETIVPYPLMPDGRPLSLRQEAYTVVIDSSKALKRIDFTMEGVLDVPVQYEIFGKDAVLKHADRIERYSIRHERKDRKDPASMEMVSAKFILLGPLPLKVTVEADIDQRQVIVTIRNFNEPGFTKYNLTVEQFSDEFLDQIGKFVLRKEDRLFGKSEELSEDAKKKLRDRMIVEARIRQQELIEAEERRKAEEAAEKERSAKEQIKRVVNTHVVKGKESLKDMFGKLKKQANHVLTPESKPAPAPVQTTQQSPLMAALSRHTEQAQQTKQEITTPQATPAPASQQAARPPAAAVSPQKPASAPPPVEVAKEQQVTRTPVADASAAPAPISAEAKITESQAVSTPVTAPAKKKVPPPKIFNASPDNPFLRPEPEAETPAPESEQAVEVSEDNSATTSAVKTTSSSNPFLQTKQTSSDQSEHKQVSTEDEQKLSFTPEDLERDLARIMEREKAAMKSQNPFLNPANASTQTAQSSENTPSNNPFLQTSKTKVAATKVQPPANKEKPKPVLKPGELSTDLSARLTIPSEDKREDETPLPEVKDPSQNPVMESEPLDIDVAGNDVPPQIDNNKEKP